MLKNPFFSEALRINIAIKAFKIVLTSKNKYRKKESKMEIVD